ncbi:MAG: bifunctional 4-hydroxy-2-oxoglutarate aldolase/2-dehydro-3-deoxy-phosphogluconate aldolase [Prolixibacteraceae bacterium]|nr:bifunctional 4-hydroxy-2-oxoglutarate aldolase/2-dehydro-3-deoxy-phosphogluconate aldolase [Prolixibacteraceae bacterium]
MNNKFTLNKFEKIPIVGILRNYSDEAIRNIAREYFRAGLTTLEVTMNSPNAEPMISFLSKEYPSINIGAGTVCEMPDLFKALDAGASFIVTPILNEEVITFCVNNDIPVFPGAFTPTEIYKAWKLGATAVKIFPAAMFGPAYIKEIRGPLNEIKLLPTGGVSLENIEGYFGNGAYGVGMGGTLFKAEFIENNNYKGLFDHFGKYVQAISSILSVKKM